MQDQLRQHKQQQPIFIEKNSFKEDILENQDFNSLSNEKQFQNSFKQKKQQYQTIQKYGNRPDKSNKSPLKKDQLDSYLELEDTTDQNDNILFEKKIKELQDNAKFFEAQAHPLFIENGYLKDQMIQLHEMIREKTRELAELVRDINEKGETRDLIKKIGNLQAIYDVLKYDFDYYQSKIYNQNDEKSLIDNRNRDLEEQLFNIKIQSQKEQELLKLAFENEITILNEKLKDLQNVIAGLQEDLKIEKNDKLDMIQKKNKELETVLKLTKDYQDQIKIQNEEFQLQKKNQETYTNQIKEKYVREKRDIIDRYEIQLREQKEQYETKLSQQMEDYDSQIRLLEESIRLKDDTLQNLNADYKRLKEVTDYEIMDIRQKYENAREEIRKLKENQNIINLELSSLKKYKEELENERNNIITELFQLREKFKLMEDEYGIYKRKAEDQISKLGRRLRDLIEEMQRKDDEQKTRLEQLSQQNELKLNEQLNNQKNGYEEQMKHLRQELERAMNMLDKEKNELIRQLNVKMIELQEENQTLKRRVEQSDQEWELKYSDVEKKLRRQLEELDQQSKNAYSELERQWKKQYELLGDKRIDDLDRQKTQLSTEIDKLSEEIEYQKKDLLARMKGLESQWKEKYDKMESELLKKMQDMKNKYESEINQIQDHFGDQIDKLQEKQQGQQFGMVDELKQNSAKEIENVQKQSQDKITLVQKQCEDQILQIQINLQKEFQMKQNQFEDKIIQQQALLDQEKELLIETKEKNAKIKENLLKEIQDLKNKLQEIESRYKDKIQAMQNLNQQKIEEFTQSLSKIRQEYDAYRETSINHLQIKDEELLKIKQEFSQFEQKLRSLTDKEVKDILKSHLDFTEKIKQEFFSTNSLQEDKYIKLDIQYKELQKLFDVRPSRTDDVKQIKGLIGQMNQYKLSLQEADQKVTQAQDIVKYLTLELDNYRNVYDVFGPGKKQPSNVVEKFQNVQMPKTDQQNVQSSSQSQLPYIQQQQPQQTQQQQQILQQNSYQLSQSPLKDPQNQQKNLSKDQFSSSSSNILQSQNQFQNGITQSGNKALNYKSKDKKQVQSDDNSPGNQQTQRKQSKILNHYLSQQNSDDQSQNQKIDLPPLNQRMNITDMTKVEPRYKKHKKDRSNTINQFQNPLENSQIMNHADKFVRDNKSFSQHPTALQFQSSLSQIQQIQQGQIQSKSFRPRSSYQILKESSSEVDLDQINQKQHQKTQKSSDIEKTEKKQNHRVTEIQQIQLTLQNIQTDRQNLDKNKFLGDTSMQDQNNQNTKIYKGKKHNAAQSSIDNTLPQISQNNNSLN